MLWQTVTRSPSSRPSLAAEQHAGTRHRRSLQAGDIKPGEAIVLTAVCSAHRAAAFDACRYLMEELKSRAPFWKKEALADGGSRWVEKNTPG